MTQGEVIALIKAFGGSGGGGGGGSSPLVINVTITDIADTAGHGTMDKTAGEIFAAMQTTGALWKASATVDYGDGDVNTSYVAPLVTGYCIEQAAYRFSDYMNSEWTAATSDDYPEADLSL